MISNKTRDYRKGRNLKMSKNIERLYKEGKCSECSVVVTRMDFAKILGKFTKVKIQYESGSAAKSKKNNQLVTSPNSRLKNNENGMVLIHRNAYNHHPANLLKKSKLPDRASPRNKAQETTPRTNNILKENNRLKKSPVPKEKADFFRITATKPIIKRYGIVFLNPKKRNENYRNKISLIDLLPSIDKSILPSDDWSIDYLPKHGEPKEDKVYDRIAAELEDLMNNEKSTIKVESKVESTDNKDEFPSIMDILNDNSTSLNNSQSNPSVQTNLESSDVEAMLLGKTSDITPSEKTSQNMEIEVTNTDLGNLMDVVQMNTVQAEPNLENQVVDNPNSPSILDETLQKGVEEHLPKEVPLENKVDVVKNDSSSNNTQNEKQNNEDFNYKLVTHVVFKKILNGACSKSVTCPKNLKYNIELGGKSVQFLGAPKFISSLEDLQVLLQIVNETESNSVYVLY